MGNIARRTVAKYRKIMSIPTARFRKSFESAVCQRHSTRSADPILRSGRSAGGRLFQIILETATSEKVC